MSGKEFYILCHTQNEKRKEKLVVHIFHLNNDEFMLFMRDLLIHIPYVS